MAFDKTKTRAMLDSLKSGPVTSIRENELLAYRGAKTEYLKRSTADDVIAPYADDFVSGLDGITTLSFDDDLIEGVVPCGELGAIIGNSNVGKTFFAATILKAVAAGLPFNGRRVEKGGAVYIGSEGSGKFERRRAALYREMDDEEADELRVNASDFKIKSAGDTFMSTFDFPVGKEPEKACAHLYRLACQFRARRKAFPVLIVIDHMMALMPKDAIGFDWQIMLTTELRALKNVVGCTLVVLVHENKSGQFYGSVVQRALWDFALHITEEMKATKRGDLKVDQPTGRRFISSDKVRDGERRSEADSFTLVSRLLGHTPNNIKVTSAVLKFSGVVAINPRVADDDGPELVARKKVIIQSDSTEKRTNQLCDAMREHHEAKYADDPVPFISYGWAQLRDIMNAYRADRCETLEGGKLMPLAPKGSDNRSDFKRVLDAAQAQGWLLKEDGEYRRTKYQPGERQAV